MFHCPLISLWRCPSSHLQTDISETEFRITVALDLPDAKEDDEPPKFILAVKYPENYPDEAPQLEIQNPANAPLHPYFSVADDRELLLEGIDETIQENLGMAMIFTIVSALKDAAEQIIQDRKDAEAKEQEERALAAEREENKKFQGTLVTAETFVKWREGFMKEMEEKKQKEEEERLAEQKKNKVKEPARLTGKQLWERGLAGKGDEEDDEDVPTEGVEKLALEA